AGGAADYVRGLNQIAAADHTMHDAVGRVAGAQRSLVDIGEVEPDAAVGIGCDACEIAVGIGIRIAGVNGIQAGYVDRSTGELGGADAVGADEIEVIHAIETDVDAVSAHCGNRIGFGRVDGRIGIVDHGEGETPVAGIKPADHVGAAVDAAQIR